MSVINSLKASVIVPIHPAGYPFIAIFLAVTIFLGIFLGVYFWFAGLIITIWCIYFFRNPMRYTPQRDSLVLSPADGKIIKILTAKPPDELALNGENWTKISIFMSVFDVHVNRSPMTGKVLEKTYFPGTFLNASLDKSSEKNERLSIKMLSNFGKTLSFVQIAGLVARRIICQVEENNKLMAGEQFGIIRFGSRVDVWLPNPILIKVTEGQRAYAGETILADFEPDKDIGKIRVE
ncbi:MAG: phosphatidylserine decarboxylase [Pseudomonadota bacterium]|nr:phosphatidylserine decarboxylase [Pseudomonadota bacterium]